MGAAEGSSRFGIDELIGERGDRTVPERTTGCRADEKRALSPWMTRIGKLRHFGSAGRGSDQQCRQGASAPPHARPEGPREARSPPATDGRGSDYGRHATRSRTRAGYRSRRPLGHVRTQLRNQPLKRLPLASRGEHGRRTDHRRGTCVRWDAAEALVATGRG